MMVWLGPTFVIAPNYSVTLVRICWRRIKRLSHQDRVIGHLKNQIRQLKA
jgi:hypothetical protein